MDNYSTDRLPYNMLFPETFAFPLIRESGLPARTKRIACQKTLELACVRDGAERERLRALRDSFRSGACD